MKLWIILVKFIFIGALFIVSNNNLYLSNVNDRAQFYNDFNLWIDGIYLHASQITGYIVDSGWLPENNSSAPSK